MIIGLILNHHVGLGDDKRLHLRMHWNDWINARQSFEWPPSIAAPLQRTNRSRHHFEWCTRILNADGDGLLFCLIRAVF